MATDGLPLMCPPFAAERHGSIDAMWCSLANIIYYTHLSMTQVRTDYSDCRRRPLVASDCHYPEVASIYPLL